MNSNSTTAKLIETAKIIFKIGLPQYLKYVLPSASSTEDLKIFGHDICVRKKTTDLEVAVSGLASELNPLEHLLDRDFDGLIVDAGGYIGTAAIKLAEYYPKAQIVSVEASSANFEMLSKNTRHLSNVDCLHAALHPNAGEVLRLYNRHTGNYGFSLLDKSKGNDVSVIEEIETVSLDALADKYAPRKIGILKLDIEGGELAIFKDPSATLQAIPAVFVELHDKIVDGCSDAFFQFSENRWVVKTDGEKLLSIAK